LKSWCTVPVRACEANGNCDDALNCIKGCKVEDVSCVFACGKNGNAQVKAIQSCFAHQCYLFGMPPATAWSTMNIWWILRVFIY